VGALHATAFGARVRKRTLISKVGMVLTDSKIAFGIMVSSRNEVHSTTLKGGDAMELKTDKAQRVLSIFSRLLRGQCIRKYQESVRFHVDERTIQRDIDDIRAFLADQMMEGQGAANVEYNRECQGYVLI